MRLRLSKRPSQCWRGRAHSWRHQAPLASGELIQLEAGGNATNRFVKVGSLKDKPEPDAISAAGTATGNVIGAAVNAAVSGGTGKAVEAA